MLGELKTTVNSSMASLSFSHGLYAVPFAQVSESPNIPRVQQPNALQLHTSCITLENVFLFFHMLHIREIN